MSRQAIINQSEQELFSELGIDPVEDGRRLKPIPKKYYHGIISCALSMTPGYNPEECHSNKHEGFFSLHFNNSTDVESFRKDFVSNVFKGINTYLTEQGCDIKRYQRSLVLSTIPDKKTLNIGY